MNFDDLQQGLNIGQQFTHPIVQGLYRGQDRDFLLQKFEEEKRQDAIRNALNQQLRDLQEKQFQAGQAQDMRQTLMMPGVSKGLNGPWSDVTALPGADGLTFSRNRALQEGLTSAGETEKLKNQFQAEDETRKLLNENIGYTRPLSEVGTQGPTLGGPPTTALQPGFSAIPNTDQALDVAGRNRAIAEFERAKKNPVFPSTDNVLAQKVLDGSITLEQAMSLKNKPRQPTLSKDFRYKADGSVEPIPGSPAASSSGKSLDAAISRAEIVTEKVDQALEKVGFWSAGMGSKSLADLGGTDATDLRADIDTIKAVLSFHELSKMREASKTGGALGNVSDRELTLLGSAVASLDQAQSAGQLRKRLAEVKTRYEKWRNTAIMAKSAESAAESQVEHPQDQEAIDWAQSHPDDPASAEILKANGL